MNGNNQQVISEITQLTGYYYETEYAYFDNNNVYPVYRNENNTFYSRWFLAYAIANHGEYQCENFIGGYSIGQALALR